MNVTGLGGFGSKLFAYVRDPDVALWRKLAGVFALLYLLSPVDAVPDFIPLLGWLDDLGVLGATAMFLAREVTNHAARPRASRTPRPASVDAQFEELPPTERPRPGTRRRVV